MAVVPVVAAADDFPKSLPRYTPTAKEVGVDAIVETLRLVAAPPDMPKERADKLVDLLVKAMNDDEVKGWVEKTGASVNPGNAVQAKQSFTQFVDLANQEQTEIRKSLKGQ